MGEINSGTAKGQQKLGYLVEAESDLSVGKDQCFVRRKYRTMCPCTTSVLLTQPSAFEFLVLHILNYQILC